MGTNPCENLTWVIRSFILPGTHVFHSGTTAEIKISITAYRGTKESRAPGNEFKVYPTSRMLRHLTRSEPLFASRPSADMVIEHYYCLIAKKAHPETRKSLQNCKCQELLTQSGYIDESRDLRPKLLAAVIPHQSTASLNIAGESSGKDRNSEKLVTHPSIWRISCECIPRVPSFFDMWSVSWNAACPPTICIYGSAMCYQPRENRK